MLKSANLADFNFYRVGKVRSLLNPKGSDVSDRFTKSWQIF